MTGRAIVMENKKGACTVMTAEGEFRRIRGNYTPGQVISLPESRWKVNKMALMAASLILFLAVSALWKTVMPSAVASYVTLDLNPAVELALDSNNVVLGIKSLDGEDAFTEGLELTGTPLETAVDKIVKTAVSKRLLSSDGEIVVSTVVLKKDKDLAKLNRLVKKTLETSLQSKGVNARVLAGQTSPEVRKKAESEGIPTGRYMLYLDAAQKGLSVKPEDFKKKKITNIEKDSKIKIKDDLKVETRKPASVTITPKGNNGDESRQPLKKETLRAGDDRKNAVKPRVTPGIKKRWEEKKNQREEIGDEDKKIPEINKQGSDKD